MKEYIKQILVNNNIVDFLEERGIFPERKSGDKLFYKCPIHNEEEPSFVVYLHNKEDYQTYFCYGCKSGVNIINLKKDIDKVSLHEAVKYFLQGIDIKDYDIVNSIIEELGYQNEEELYEIYNDFYHLYLMISSVCREHLQKYRDKEEIVFFEDVFYLIDDAALRRDIQYLENVYNILIDKGGLEKRVDLYKKREEDRMLIGIKNE